MTTLVPTSCPRPGLRQDAPQAGGSATPIQLEVGVEIWQEYCLSVTGVCTDQGVELYDAPAIGERLRGTAGVHAPLFSLEASQDGLQLAGGREEWPPEQDRDDRAKLGLKCDGSFFLRTCRARSSSRERRRSPTASSPLHAFVGLNPLAFRESRI